MTTDYQPPTGPLRRGSDLLGSSGPGRWLMTQAVCAAAPYSRTISPRFLVLEPGHVEAFVPNRRGVRNHLGSVHAIAMCNAAELVAGTCIDLCVDRRLRWIPTGMTVRYQKIARTDLRAICKLPESRIFEEGEVVMPVSVLDTAGVEVFAADVTMRVTRKKP